MPTKQCRGGRHDDILHTTYNKSHSMQRVVTSSITSIVSCFLLCANYMPLPFEPFITHTDREHYKQLSVDGNVTKLDQALRLAFLLE